MLAPFGAENPASDCKVMVLATGVPAEVETEVGLAVISTLLGMTWNAMAEEVTEAKF
jgi:hypothetical protein